MLYSLPLYGLVTVLGDKVDKGLSYLPTRLHRLAGRYDNPMTESTTVYPPFRDYEFGYWSKFVNSSYPPPPPSIIVHRRSADSVTMAALRCTISLIRIPREIFEMPLRKMKKIRFFLPFARKKLLVLQ